MSAKPTCRLYMKGKCPYGEKCKFAHVEGGLPAASEQASAESNHGLLAFRAPTPPPIKMARCCDDETASNNGKGDRLGPRSLCTKDPTEGDPNEIDARCATECHVVRANSHVLGYMGDCENQCRDHQKQRRWLVDSGAGRNLIGRGILSHDEQEILCGEGIARKLHTANGVVTTRDSVQCHVNTLSCPVNALVLSSCPPVLSLGGLIDHGYSFHWSKEDGATLTGSDGKCIQLVIEGHVPFLEEDRVQPVGDNRADNCMKCLDASPGEEVGDDLGTSEDNEDDCSGGDPVGET